MKLVYQYMAILINLSPTSSRLHSLQVENCDSNLRLVVDEDDNGKFRLEMVYMNIWCIHVHILELHKFFLIFVLRIHQLGWI